MLKTVRVPIELLAIERKRRGEAREAGTPLYLPAYQPQFLEADALDDNDLDPGVEAGGLTIGWDDDAY